MMPQRQNEPVSLAAHRNSVFQLKSDGWYFKTREGFEFGPYFNKRQVELARDVFVYSITGDANLKRWMSQSMRELFDVDEYEINLPSETLRVA
jgi:hypothetical protein